TAACREGENTRREQRGHSYLGWRGDATPATLAPHQPRPACDAAYPLERGSVVADPGRVQKGARASDRDSARGVVQLIVTNAPGGPRELHRALTLLLDSRQDAHRMDLYPGRGSCDRAWIAFDLLRSGTSTATGDGFI